MTTEQKIKKRISYIRSELSAGGHLDGWTLKFLEKELIEKESTLLQIHQNPIIPDILGNR
jgi:hypothetical protein